MTDGHSDGSGCGSSDHAVCIVPDVSEATLVAPAPTVSFPVVNGVEINRATILEKAKQRRLDE